MVLSVLTDCAPHLTRNTATVIQHRALRSVLVSAALALAATAAFAESGSPTPSIGEPAQERTSGVVPEFGVTTGYREMVMPPMSQITATTSVGTITITAGKGFKRCYTWEGATGCVTLNPSKVRWQGVSGAGSGGFPAQ